MVAGSGGRARTVRALALGLCGVFMAVTLVVRLATGGPAPPALLFAALMCAAAGFALAGVHALVPPRPAHVVGWIGSCAGVAFYLLLTAGLLITPEDMVGTGPRAPHSPGGARLLGLVLLAVMVVATLAALRSWARGRGGSRGRSSGGGAAARS